jgi:hypothetical protein
VTFQIVEQQTKTKRIITINFHPNKAQDPFIHAPDPNAAIVASVAAGKTTALCMRAWLLSRKYPANKGILCMFTYDQIRNALIPKWKECIPNELMRNPECLDRKDLAMQTLWLESDDPARPSAIQFRNLEDFHKFESEEIGWFGICQANDPRITRKIWDTLNERLRWPVPYHYAFLEANWGGNASKGGWIWDVFKDKKEGLLIEADTMVNWDNLSRDYQERLANLPEYRRLHSIYGSWDPLIEVNGLPVYPEFKFGWHTPEDGAAGDVRKLFVPDRPIIRGIDVPGPGACVWTQMDERGRLLVGHEVTLDVAIGAAEFADIIQSDSASFFPGARYADYVDPAALRVEMTSGKSIVDVLREKGLRPMGAAIAIEKRLQAVKDWLTMAVRGDAGLLIDPGCHRLIGGFQGGYYYNRIGLIEGRYAPTPIKSVYSHVHDALQYACNGVARLQYRSADRGAEAPPMPSYWLGALHPDKMREATRTTNVIEDDDPATSRARRNLLVRRPRVGW